MKDSLNEYSSWYQNRLKERKERLLNMQKEYQYKAIFHRVCLSISVLITISIVVYLCA